MAFNVEAFDINKDGKKDIVVGNWNDTYVYFGGKGMLDSTVDVVYKGRMLAICDYDGDGFKDLITMHLTKYDSSTQDYDGELLFYWGSDTEALAIDTLSYYSIPLPTLYPIHDEFSLGLTRPGVEHGDFNKDGKTDIVINSLDAKPDGVGVVYIYMGNNIPPDTATFKVRGRAYVPGKPPIDWYGNYFQVGDINGDGYDDLLLSSKIEKVPPANPYDSVEALDIYLGGNNFAFLENRESSKYESMVQNDFISSGWVKKEFSLADINGDGIPDLIINHFYKDSTDHVHLGSINAIDTIPSFYLTDPDTTRTDVVVGGTCFNIGDFNNDGFDDFILGGSAYKSFSLHLGGSHLNNKNPYGLRGLLEAAIYFPTKATRCGDQNGDGVEDFVAIANSYSLQNMGYVLVFLGDPTIKTDVIDKAKVEPESFQLFQNYPNPFNPTTLITYQLAVNGFVTLKVYDLLGRTIATLVQNQMLAGKHQAEFDAEMYKLGTGIYIYQLNTQKRKTSKKMLYLK